VNKVITQLFEKNLNSIKNLKLREKLVNYNPRNSVLLQNTNGYNLVFNNTFLHDVNSPLQEAKTIIENCKNCNSEINLIFGLGLGYLLQLGFRELKGKIILFEPELEIIYTAFNYVDFSKELSSEKVFVSDDFNEIKNELSRMKYIQTPTIISLNSGTTKLPCVCMYFPSSSISITMSLS